MSIAMRILKWTLAVTDRQHVSMPYGATILQVANQNDAIVLWALCEETEVRERRTFAIHGTGHSISDATGYGFLGTVLTSGGALVWHVFEISGLDDAP
jgi:hypothetical protein